MYKSLRSQIDCICFKIHSTLCPMLLSLFAFWLFHGFLFPNFLSFEPLNPKVVSVLIAKPFDIAYYCVRVLGRSASSFKHGPLHCDSTIGRNYNFMGANTGGWSSSCSEAGIECLKSICST